MFYLKNFISTCAELCNVKLLQRKAKKYVRIIIIKNQKNEQKIGVQKMVHLINYNNKYDDKLGAYYEYIGGKSLLLENINAVIRENAGEISSVIDVFAG